MSSKANGMVTRQCIVGFKGYADSRNTNHFLSGRKDPSVARRFNTQHRREEARYMPVCTVMSTSLQARCGNTMNLHDCFRAREASGRWVQDDRLSSEVLGDPFRMTLTICQVCIREPTEAMPQHGETWSGRSEYVKGRRLYSSAALAVGCHLW